MSDDTAVMVPISLWNRLAKVVAAIDQLHGAGAISATDTGGATELAKLSVIVQDIESAGLHR